MSSTKLSWREGAVVGVIAYAAVALFYGLFDFFAARGPLYTVDMLGKAFFRGLRDPGVLQYPTEIDSGAIFWYNALHLATALAIGLTVVWLIRQAQTDQGRGRGILLTILTGFVVTIVAVAGVTQQMRPVLPVWSIVTANAFASLAAGLFLLRRHPGLGRLLLGLRN